MARYRYVAFTEDGKREAGTLDVTSETEAWAKLTAMGLLVVELVPGEAAKTRPFGSRRRLRLSEQADLADQLSLLFAAKLPALEIVRVIELGATTPGFVHIFNRIGLLLADGQSLSAAIQDAGHGLSPLFATLTRIGETTGDPAPLMAALARSLRRQEKLSSQISGALVYPAILLVGGLCVFLLMALFLAPRIATIFTSIDRPLPFALGIFIAFGDTLRNWGWLLLIGLAGATTLASATFFRLRFRLPVIGGLLREASLSRLSRSLSLMLSAGVPLAPALKEASAASPNDPIAQLFDSAGTAIESGGTGREVFASAPNLPASFRELYAIGERTNTLAAVMAAVASGLEESVERKAQRTATLLTPILTLVIGGGIALLVYAVMSALLSVNDLAF
ncbi:PulF Type II secretory pathway, component PulF [Paracoccaceae bacterium]